MAVTFFGGGLLTGCISVGEEAREVHYTCNPGPDITVIFKPMEATLIQQGSEPVRLSGRHTPARFRFESVTHSLVGKGQNLTLTVGRAAPVHCREVRRRPR